MARSAILAVPLLAAALAVGGPARAGLFDDDEARKAILDLRARIAATDEAARARSAEQAAALEQIRRSLLELNAQLETLRADMAKLRGADEQIMRDVSELQRRQKDLAQGVDERVRKLEPQKVAVDGKEFLADPDEKRQFDEALAMLRSGDFEKAAAMMSSFSRRYPSSGYGDSARFWLGNAHYGRRDYKEAIATFRAFLAGAPSHPRAPEAMLAIANCQAEMKDVRGARKTLDELLKTYPNTEAAGAGKERLATLKG